MARWIVNCPACRKISLTRTSGQVLVGQEVEKALTRKETNEQDG
jgi:hypothetical protein